MTDTDIQAARQHNISVFTTMLGHLGRQEYEACGRYLAPDIYADWPYIPAPGCPDHIVGREPLLAFFKGGMSDFDPYAYQITQIHPLVDPNQLIAEYFSDSRFHPNGRRYSNKYCAILRFEGGLVTYWREYVNPETIRLVMA